MADSQLLADLAALRHNIARDLDLLVDFTYRKQIGRDARGMATYRKSPARGVVRSEAIVYTSPITGRVQANRTVVFVAAPLIETLDDGTKAEIVPKLDDTVQLGGRQTPSQIARINGTVSNNDGASYFYELHVE